MSTHKTHTDEADIDRSLVQRLIATQFPKWADLLIEPVASAGTDNAIYRLGADMVVRLPRIKEAASHIDKEYRWPPQLAPHLPLAIPVPVAKGCISNEFPWPWSIYRWLDGDNAVVGHIANFRQAAIDLGKFVAALHQIDSTNGPRASRGRPLNSFDAEAREAIISLKDIGDTQAISALWDAALSEAPWERAPVWVHGDLHANNLLVLQGRVHAVIDFGMSGIGDPACDMMVAWTLLTAETRNLFREAVQVDDATWARGRGWALYFGVVALPYYMKTNPVLAGIARKTIDEVLADSRNSEFF